MDVLGASALSPRARSAHRRLASFRILSNNRITRVTRASLGTFSPFQIDMYAPQIPPWLPDIHVQEDSIGSLAFALSDYRPRVPMHSPARWMETPSVA